MSGSFTVEIASGVAGIDAREWDALAAPEAVAGGRAEKPFLTHRILSGLEHSRSVGPGTGWLPRPLLLRGPQGELLGAAPLYVKTHSLGEYVFDHAWAHGWEQAGGRYYPKLQIAVPFTPVTGRRLLARPGQEAQIRPALLAAARRLAAQEGLSSVHVTFCTGEEAALGARLGLLHRIGEQFHWENRGYRSFAEFLGALSSRKRKAIRRERGRARAFGGRILRLTGDELRPEHWDAMWAFYQDTGARKWGTPYLTRAFFDHLHQTMRDDVLLVLAERDGRFIAGALNLIGRSTLFGRYWGALEHHPFLHFEICYHQAIEFAIETGLARIEAGAQGEHKLARGYMPRPVHSLHWFADPRLHAAVEAWIAEERQAVAGEIALLAEHGPFRRGPKQEGSS